MNQRSLVYRRIVDLIVRFLSGLAALIGVFFLVWILYTIVRQGMDALSFRLLIEKTLPPGMEGGGVGNAIMGTLLLTVLATFIGVPIGLCAGIYLAEFGRESRLADVVRFSANTLMGMPSIIIGIFVYSLIVLRTGHFSGYAGAVALAIIMLPVVARTAEDMLLLVPNALRESALALGVPRWKAINNIVFRAAKSGLLTGILLAIARVSGETAPLLFTALNNDYWPLNLSEPTASLPVTINSYASQPDPFSIGKAWAASLLVTVGVLGLTLAARLALRARK